jgi:hypothetical protein
MRKGDRQRILHRRPDRDRGKGVVAARAIQVAKPQTRIAELPFSAINLRRWRPGNPTVNDSFRLVGRKPAFHNEHGVRRSDGIDATSAGFRDYRMSRQISNVAEKANRDAARCSKSPKPISSSALSM